MQRNSRLSLLSAIVAILGVGVVQAAGQEYRAPRGPDGRPDLNGIWQALNEANFDIETHVARSAMALRPGPYGPVPAAPVLALGAVGAVPPSLGVVEGGEIPYRPEALARRRQNQSDWLNLDPEIKCYIPGVPRATYMPYPFQILQSTSELIFVYEYAGAVRNIFLKDPGPAPADSWMGKSVGRWEGDTLVIDVTVVLRTSGKARRRRGRRLQSVLAQSRLGLQPSQRTNSNFDHPRPVGRPCAALQ
jgi:hypothetical protein